MNVGLIVDLSLLTILITIAFFVARCGLWQAALVFLDLLLAASLATAWYEPVADYLQKYLAPYTYFLDITAIWVLFMVPLLVLMTATQQVGKQVVRFPKYVDLAGSILIGLMTAWTVIEFAGFSLHVAPVRNEAVPLPPAKSMFFGFGPDSRWLWWVRGGSRNGPFAVPDHPFDSDGDFFARHAKRREGIAEQPSLILPE
jgi:hypothetical protein